LEGRVQVRAHGTPLPARARLDGDIVRVELHEPAMGVAPGQAAVLYDGTRVVGSATISATEAAAAHA
jgi:tRNA-specific 2-thiouridylase